MRRAVLLAVLAALAVPAAATARTIELGWREEDGVGVMRFSVSTLTLGARTWSVRGSFTNLSTVPLRIEPWHLPLVLVVTACGGGAHTNAARPGTYELGWHERDGPIVIDVQRLVVRAGSWRVTLTVANRSRYTWDIDRPHVPGSVRFGLLTTAKPGNAAVATSVGTGRLPFLFAERFTPPLPRRLRQGERWRGSMGGAGVLPRGRYVRVTVGRFGTTEHAPDPSRFYSVTERSFRLP